MSNNATLFDFIKIKEIADRRPKTKCGRCNKTELQFSGICEGCKLAIEAEGKERRYQDRLENMGAHLKLIGVGKRYIGCTLDDFEDGGKYVKACKDFLSNPHHGLFFSGGYGSGKTHLAVGICRELLKIKRVPTVVFTTGAELLLNIRKTYSDPKLSEPGVIAVYCEPDYLVIDDLGAEKPTEWAKATLHIILERRDSEMMPTIVTSNLTLKQISETLGGRVGSRLANSRVISVSMPDRRRKRIAGLS